MSLGGYFWSLGSLTVTWGRDGPGFSVGARLDFINEESEGGTGRTSAQSVGRSSEGRPGGGCLAREGPLCASACFAVTVGPVGASGSSAPCLADWVGFGISAAASGHPCQMLSPGPWGAGPGGAGGPEGEAARGRETGKGSLLPQDGASVWGLETLGLGCSLCSRGPCAIAVGLFLHFTCTCSQTSVPDRGGQTPHVPSARPV